MIVDPKPNRKYKHNYIDLTDKTFGRWTVKSRAGSARGNRPLWKCVCVCGKEGIVRGETLRNGSSKSCGCLRKEIMRNMQLTHGLTGTPTKRVWDHMNTRCYNKNSKDYKNYGGRGITVCKHWEKFENFLEDMGRKPPKLTIERKDNSRGYSPDNCRWATLKEQQRNRRDNLIINYQGKSQCLSAWAEELKVCYSTLYGRIKRYPPQIAFNM